MTPTPATPIAPLPKSWLDKIAPYRKSIVVAVGALTVILTNAFGADSAVVQDVVIVASVLGVYSTPNG